MQLPSGTVQLPVKWFCLLNSSAQGNVSWHTLRRLSESPAPHKSFPAYEQSLSQNNNVSPQESLKPIVVACRKQLGELLRFPSSKSGDDLISLGQYTERAKEGQKNIYYIAADSLAAAASAPFLEQLIKKDLEAGSLAPCTAPLLVRQQHHPYIID